MLDIQPRKKKIGFNSESPLNASGGRQNFTTANGLQVSGSTWTPEQERAFKAPVSNSGSRRVLAGDSAGPAASPGFGIGGAKAPGTGIDNDSLFNQALDAINSMPTRDKGFSGAAGAARAHTMRVKKARMLADLYAGRAGLGVKEDAQTGRTNATNATSLARQGLANEGSLARQGLANEGSLERERLSGQNALARQKLSGQQTADRDERLHGYGVEDTVMKAGYDRDADTRKLVAALAERGVEITPEMQNTYNMGGDIDLVGTQVPRDTSKNLVKPTYIKPQFDDSGKRLPGTGEWAMPPGGYGIGGGQPQASDPATPFDPNNVTPEWEAWIRAMSPEERDKFTKQHATQ